MYGAILLEDSNQKDSNGAYLTASNPQKFLKKGAGEALLQGGKSGIRKQVYKYEDGKVVFYKADE
jgi:hypothetical protein